MCFFTPAPDEAMWARERTGTDEHLLALTLALKCFQKMARFPKPREVPPAVVEHVRRCLELGDEVEPVYASRRTAESHRVLVRRYVGVAYAPGKVRKIAEKAMREAAWVKNHPTDLINVALEKLQALLVVGPSGRSDLQRLKRPARRATWSKFKDQAAHLEWMNGLGDIARVLEGIAASKIADFAGEADAADADVLARSYPVEAKRLALLACLAYTAQAQARDDLALMLCKRMAVNVGKAKRRLAEIHDRQRAVTEQLIGTYRQVLQGLAPSGAAGVAQAAATQILLAALSGSQDGAERADTGEETAQETEEAGGAVPAGGPDDGESGSGRTDGAPGSAPPGATAGAGGGPFAVVDALDHALAYWSKTREVIPDNVGGIGLDLSFSSVNWRRAIRDRKHPGMLVKRHFEAMVFAYLAEELRTGDMAVAGGGEFGDWSQHLLTFDECRPLLPVFCEEAGLPATADGFVTELKNRHAAAAAALDAGYHDNEDPSFGDDGVPTLKKLVGWAPRRRRRSWARRSKRGSPSGR